MAKDKKGGTKVKSSGNAKVEFGNGKKKKRTSIGSSGNSRPKNKDAVRAKRGR